MGSKIMILESPRLWSHWKRDPVKLGGEWWIVEIEKPLFKRPKYNSGKDVFEQWMFRIWDKQERRRYIFPVIDRTLDTLLGLFRMLIILGNIIHSEYNGIDVYRATQGYHSSEAWLLIIQNRQSVWFLLNFLLINPLKHSFPGELKEQRQGQKVERIIEM